MSDRALAVVQTYYDIIGSGTGTFDPDRLRAVLAPDLAFEGPIAGAMTGADRFVVGVSGFVETMSGMTVLHRVADDHQVASLYDAAMPGGPARIAEFIEVADDRIASLRLLYDAGDYTAKGGR